VKNFDHYSATRDNNFNLIRFIAASLVIFSHSYPIALGHGTPEPPTTWIGMSAGNIAVSIFFVVSGFLVSKSFCDRNNLFTFFYARCLRIFPALIVAVLSSVFIVGLLFTELSLYNYLTDFRIYKYIIKNITLIVFSLQYNLPGVFTENIYPAAVNGSLWTLPAEFRMYLLIALLGWMGILCRVWLFNGFIVLAVLAYFYTDHYVIALSAEVWRLAAFFLAGTFCYINRKFIPLNGYILLGILALTIGAWHTPYFKFSFYLLLSYATFWFSLVPAGRIRLFNQIGDYSYGIYIYAFPIQQMIAALYPGIQPLEMCAWAFLATLLCAYFSWHWVEKPALKLKLSLNSSPTATV